MCAADASHRISNSLCPSELLRRAAAMTSSIRPSTPADAPAMGALFMERGMHLNLDSRFLDWKYWQPRDDWAGPRSFVVTRGNELIAHAAIVPGTCAWAGRRI